MKSTGRGSARLQFYDYRSPGIYFVTTVVKNRLCLFGDVKRAVMEPYSAGRMVMSVWQSLPERFPHIQLGAYVVMPNHFHALLMITNDRRAKVNPIGRGDHKDRPYLNNEVSSQSTRDQVRRDPDNRTERGQSKPHEHDADETSPQSMPDQPRRGEPGVRPKGTRRGSLGRIMQAFKSITTVLYIEGVHRHGWRRFPGKLWQRGYYDYIVRSEQEVQRITRYILDNPIRWELDDFNLR